MKMILAQSVIFHNPWLQDPLTETNKVQIHAQALTKYPTLPMYHGPGTNRSLKRILQKIGMPGEQINQPFRVRSCTIILTIAPIQRNCGNIENPEDGRIGT